MVESGIDRCSASDWSHWTLRQDGPSYDICQQVLWYVGTWTGVISSHRPSHLSCGVTRVNITGLPLVREKSGKFKVRKKSGNFVLGQGNLRF